MHSKITERSNENQQTYQTLKDLKIVDKKIVRFETLQNIKQIEGHRILTLKYR